MLNFLYQSNALHKEGLMKYYHEVENDEKEW